MMREKAKRGWHGLGPHIPARTWTGEDGGLVESGTGAEHWTVVRDDDVTSVYFRIWPMGVWDLLDSGGLRLGRRQRATYHNPVLASPAFRLEILSTPTFLKSRPLQ